MCALLGLGSISFFCTSAAWLFIYLIYFDFLSRSVRVLAISTGVPYFGAVNTKNKIVLNDITGRYYWLTLVTYITDWYYWPILLTDTYYWLILLTDIPDWYYWTILLTYTYYWLILPTDITDWYYWLILLKNVTDWYYWLIILTDITDRY